MAQRLFFDRVLASVSPAVVTDYAPGPTRVADGLWSLERRLRMPGGPVMPARTHVARLPDASLAVISPPPPGPGGLEALDALGPVRHVVAPNSFHHLYAASFLERHPGARLYAAPGLAERVPALPAAETLGAEPPAAWGGAFELAALETRGLSEVILFHVASGTAILSDLAFNLTRFVRRGDRFFWRLFGVPQGFGPSRNARLVFLRDAAAARACLTRVRGWPLRRLAVAHGETVESDAQGTFERAFARYLT